MRRIKYVDILVREVKGERKIRRSVKQLSSSQDNGGGGVVGEKRIRNN